MPNERKMKKVRVDEALLEQIDWYDFFPRAICSRQGKVNYLIQIGLAVLKIDFKQECKNYPVDGEKPNVVTQVCRDSAVLRLLKQADETTVPNSDLARLVNRSL